MAKEERGDNAPLVSTALPDLILEANEKDGITYAQMAANAKHELSGSYFHQLAHGKARRAPEAATVAAIAAGIKRPESEVKEAVARTYGVYTSHDIDYGLSRLLHLVRSMSRPSRDRWFRLASAIADTLAKEEEGAINVSTVTVDEFGRRSDNVVDRRLNRELDAQEEIAERRRNQRQRNH